jgi:hypothetical protein
MEDCSRCSQLLADYGEAVLRFRELEKGRSEHNRLRLYRDYDAAKAECVRLRTRLLDHLYAHEKSPAAKHVS